MIGDKQLRFVWFKPSVRAQPARDSQRSAAENSDDGIPTANAQFVISAFETAHSWFTKPNKDVGADPPYDAEEFEYQLPKQDDSQNVGPFFKPLSFEGFNYDHSHLDRDERMRRHYIVLNGPEERTGEVWRQVVHQITTLQRARQRQIGSILAFLWAARIRQTPLDSAPEMHGEQMRRLLHLDLERAKWHQRVFLVGETGAGKELLARSIHEKWFRELNPQAPFVVLNGALLEEERAYADLFGYVAGAFTGAHWSRPGALMLADGGTLFLDEIHWIPRTVQAKLLRVLEEQVVSPMGAPDLVVPTRVRLIAGTNRTDLAAEVRNGRLLPDLYTRLASLEIRLDPLRARRSDIPEVAVHWLDKHQRVLREAASLPAGAKLEITETGREKLRERAWPWEGNVRDLQNVVARAASATLAAFEREIPSDTIHIGAEAIERAARSLGSVLGGASDDPASTESGRAVNVPVPQSKGSRGDERLCPLCRDARKRLGLVDKHPPGKGPKEREGRWVKDLAFAAYKVRFAGEITERDMRNCLDGSEWDHVMEPLFLSGVCTHPGKEKTHPFVYTLERGAKLTDDQAAQLVVQVFDHRKKKETQAELEDRLLQGRGSSHTYPVWPTDLCLEACKLLFLAFEMRFVQYGIEIHTTDGTKKATVQDLCPSEKVIVWAHGHDPSEFEFLPQEADARGCWAADLPPSDAPFLLYGTTTHAIAVERPGEPRSDHSTSRIESTL